MRVAFIGRSHAFSLAPLRQLALTHEVVAVIESAPRGTGGRLDGAGRRLRTMRARYSLADSLPYIARSVGVEYFWLDRGSRPRLREILQHARPDILCIASLGHLLDETILKVAPLGAYNLHPSMLPLYRGPFPWFWQYHDFVMDIGVTVHGLDIGEDTGPIVAQQPLQLSLGLDVRDAMVMAGNVGGELMSRAVDQLGAGTAVLQPQSGVAGGPRARRVKSDERFIDWDEWPLDRVWHFMRGTYPWVDHFDRSPGSPTGSYGVGERVSGSPGGRPGQLCSDAAGHFVAHPDGRIRVTFS